MKAVNIIVTLAITITCNISKAQERPGIFFREDWKTIPAEVPLSQKHVMHDELTLHLYGPGRDSLKKSHHDQPLDDPYYVWSGLCMDNWAVALEHKHQAANLTGLSKIRWRSKQAGFRQLRLIIELANGDWLISEQSDGASSDWRITEFNIADIHWRKLDIEQIVEGAKVENPDLSKVQQIGFTDLMKGGKSIACSRLDWIEVYAFSIKK